MSELTTGKIAADRLKEFTEKLESHQFELVSKVELAQLRLFRDRWLLVRDRPFVLVAQRAPLLMYADDNADRQVDEAVVRERNKSESPVFVITELPPTTLKSVEPSPASEDAANRVLHAVLAAIEADPHSWSTRPCASCSAVSAIVGRPFGCLKKAEVLRD